MFQVGMLKTPDSKRSVPVRVTVRHFGEILPRREHKYSKQSGVASVRVCLGECCEYKRCGVSGTVAYVILNNAH